MNPKGFVKSLRNNAFVRFAHQEKFGRSEQAMIRPHFEESLTTPPPSRLGYSDYNLYHSPAAKSRLRTRRRGQDGEGRRLRQA